MKKGDPLQTARLAGIMAAKRTAEIIPLCHPLPLTHVDVELVAAPRRLRITGRAGTVGRTGVEMEALVAVAVAALTLYDMLKAVDRAIVIGPIVLRRSAAAAAASIAGAVAGDTFSELHVRVVLAVHDPPVWTMPDAQVARIAAACRTMRW